MSSISNKKGKNDSSNTDCDNSKDITINNNCPLNRNMFTFNYVIGKGGFGKVWQVNYKKTNKSYALKEMSKRKILDKKSEKSITNELLILKKLNHPFIVNMYYAFQDNDNLYLVIDFLSGGDLRFHCSRYRTFSEEQVRFFISCMILGLEHIHNNNIIHRDIKPENLVIDEKGYLRITDFGIARINKKDNSCETSGTPGYMSPEVMEGKNHSFSVDFFAIGVIGYEFMRGKRPYNGKNRKEIKEKMFSKKINLKKKDLQKGWSMESIDFINHLLERKPDFRLGNDNGISELKEHPWLKYYLWDELKNKELPAPFIPDQNDNYDKRYCESVEVITEETKIRYDNIYNSPRYKIAFQNFYFNIETQMKINNKNENINKNKVNINNDKNIKKTIDNINKENSKDNNKEKESINIKNKNKILINIRKILYETNNENVGDNYKQEIINNNNFIKESIEEGKIKKKKTIDLTKKGYENNFIMKNEEYKNINKLNKKEILKQEKYNPIYHNYNSNNSSPTISIKNIFVNYYNSSPKSYYFKNNKIKNNSNLYNAVLNNNKNKIFTPTIKRNIDYQMKTNNIYIKKINNKGNILNNIKYNSLIKRNIEQYNLSPFENSNKKYYIQSINYNNNERSLLIKKTQNLLLNKRDKNSFLNNTYKLKLKNNNNQRIKNNIINFSLLQKNCSDSENIKQLILCNNINKNNMDLIK